MISVVIAAYNTEKYIAKCLESLKKQTYTEFEAIVVVDGATDETLGICEEFSKQDSRFITVSRLNHQKYPCFFLHVLYNKDRK